MCKIDIAYITALFSCISRKINIVSTLLWTLHMSCLLLRVWLVGSGFFPDNHPDCRSGLCTSGNSSKLHSGFYMQPNNRSPCSEPRYLIRLASKYGANPPQPSLTPCLRLCLWVWCPICRTVHPRTILWQPPHWGNILSECLTATNLVVLWHWMRPQWTRCINRRPTQSSNFFVFFCVCQSSVTPPL